MNPSVKKNYIYHLLFEILKIALPFITAPYVSRVLGADGLGIYSFTNSSMTYFILLAALGTSSYATREIARHRDNRAEYSKLFWEIELLSVGTSAFSLLLWLGFIALSDNYRIYYLCFTPLLVSNMFDISWFFTGQEQVKYVVLRNLVCKIIGVVCLFVFIKEKSDLPLYILINTLITLLGSISMWSYLPKMLDKVDFKTLSIKRHFRETLVYFVPSIATSIYTVLDKTLIGLITSDNYQSGYYEQATNITNMIKPLVFTSVNSVMGARTSYLYAENHVKEIKQRLHVSLDFILFLAYGCTFGLIGVSHSFVLRFLGEEFMPVATMLSMMAPLIFIIGISNCIGSIYYTPSGNRALSSRFLIVGSVFNLVFNVLLIPRYGAYGAIISSTIAEGVITLLYVHFDDGMMTWSQIAKISVKKVIAAAVMLGVIMALEKVLPFTGYLKVFSEVILGGSVYLLGLFILRDELFMLLLKMAGDFLRKIFKK